MPRLSVLIPAYNAESHIRKAIESTLRALPRDAEVHVVDDGSADNTADHLHSIDDKRLVVHQNAQNVGIVRSLNRLLAETDSLYVARMDADDYCFPWRFRAQFAAIRGVDAVFSTMTQFGRRRVKIELPFGLSPTVTRVAMLHENVLAHPTLLAHRKSIEAVGGYRQTASEDYDLWLRMLTSGARIRRIAVPTVAYRQHPQQTTRNTQWVMSSRDEPLLRDALNELASKNFDSYDLKPLERVFLKRIQNRSGLKS